LIISGVRPTNIFIFMDLIKQYKEMHKDENLYEGSSLNIHKDNIRQYLIGCESILDYGCGKAIQYYKEKTHETHFFGIMPSLYDPAVEQYSVLPEGTFDAVICTDVLEHIEEQHVGSIIKEIYSKANKFVYLGICNIPANSFLPDGRNAHVTLKDLKWWVEQTLPYANIKTLMYVYGKGNGKAILDNYEINMFKDR